VKRDSDLALTWLKLRVRSFAAATGGFGSLRVRAGAVCGGDQLAVQRMSLVKPCDIAQHDPTKTGNQINPSPCNSLEPASISSSLARNSHVPALFEAIMISQQPRVLRDMMRYRRVPVGRGTSQP
jgi:hypothetical protein